MARIVLDKMSVGFPILHVGHLSLKKSLVATVTGGAIVKEAHKPPYVMALRDLTATFAAGDRVGLIGPNGSGKTTLLRAIAGIYEPLSGDVHTEGHITTLLDVGMGFMPDMTGRENITIRGMYSGLRPSQIRSYTEEIEAFTELGPYLDMPIRTYSSGMQLRLAFAIVTSTQPDILLMDEWVLAGDTSFMNKAQERMQRFVSGSSILVLASHSHVIIQQWCNKVMYLRGGVVQVFGDVTTGLHAYGADIAKGI